MQLAEKKEAVWEGDPIYRIPTACRDARNTWRVWHRDIEGRVVAEFIGPNAQSMAEQFCELFGEPSGSRRAAIAAEKQESASKRTGETLQGEWARHGAPTGAME